MNYKSLTLSGYLKMIAAPTAVPGGGSVSAYAGALGSALLSMATAITGKKITDPRARGITAKKYIKMCSLAARMFKSHHPKLLKLAEQDSKSYDNVLQAYRLPHYNLNRRHRINQALVKASEIPAQVMAICIRNLEVLNDLKHHFPAQILSDVNVGLLMTRAALRGARMNVLINIESIKDKQLVKKLEHQLQQLDKAAEKVLYHLEEWA